MTGCASRYARLAKIPTEVVKMLQHNLYPSNGDEYRWLWEAGTRRREAKLATLQAWAAKVGGFAKADGVGIEVSCQLSSRMYAYWRFWTAEHKG